jgi:hypothetical protein
MVASMFRVQGVAGRNTGRKRKTEVHLTPQLCGGRRSVRNHQITLATEVLLLDRRHVISISTAHLNFFPTLLR